ncbi:putative Porin domain superfamily, eukaryotic porin/Tom40 [Helianthus annuus]|nr:putative Porin domain superfamily, eukaryotic porin/Tom40 [Helianthus annuus]KAJ0782357.1 putative Porin domain superfamily, eukaryotic porin/Tom40 [Helianthus annuus]
MVLTNSVCLTNTAVGAELSHGFSSNENTLTIGTQHSLDPLTTMKARVNNVGIASALLQHEWRPKSLVTISGEVDTRAIDKSAKVGLALGYGGSRPDEFFLVIVAVMVEGGGG